METREDVSFAGAGEAVLDLRCQQPDAHVTGASREHREARRRGPRYKTGRQARQGHKAGDRQGRRHKTGHKAGGTSQATRQKAQARPRRQEQTKSTICSLLSFLRTHKQRHETYRDAQT